MRLWPVASGVAWRTLKNVFTNPSLFFPSLLFVFLFLSSMNTPRNLIGVDWFRAVATVNPVSYLIECVRSLIITGWNSDALALGFGFAVLIGIVSTTAASLALRERLVRT